MADDSLVHYQVEANYAGWTLAAYLAEKLKRPLPGDRLERMLRSRALVHEEPQALLPETLVWPGLRFALRKRSPGDQGEPPDVPVIFEDDALLVLDKPPGLALHPTARYHVTTLTWALENRHKNAAGEKPDPAHRLDRETSGLVACGRNSYFTRRLKAAFAARQVEKAYLALCEGAPEERFEVQVPLVVGGGRVKVKVRVDPAGAASDTQFEVRARYHDSAGAPLAMVRCVPLTGRQHQIRAHLQAAGFPLVGDKLYGPSEEIFLRLAESGGTPAPPGMFDDLITPQERLALRLWRQALHAAELTVPHPATGEPMHFTAPMPADIAALVASLRPA